MWATHRVCVCVDDKVREGVWGGVGGGWCGVFLGGRWGIRKGLGKWRAEVRQSSIEHI